MRPGLNEVEKLAPVPFVLLAGLIGGVLQSLGEFAHNTVAGALVAYLILTGAAIILWWVSVRRRRYSVWSTAVQIAVAVTLAQIVSFAMVVPRVLPANVHLQWLDVAETELFTQLGWSPLRFLEAAILIALGRLLPGSARLQVN